jgi:hypothetical protein
MRYGIVIRLGVPGKGFHDDIGFAGIFYGSAGDNSPGITIEDYLEHDIGGIGGSAQQVVVECRIESAQVYLIDEVFTVCSKEPGMSCRSRQTVRNNPWDLSKYLYLTIIG